MEPTATIGDATLFRVTWKDCVLLQHEVRQVCSELLEARKLLSEQQKAISDLTRQNIDLSVKLENIQQKPATNEVDWLKTCITSMRRNTYEELRHLDSALDDRTGRLMALEAWAASIGFKGAQQ